MNPSLVLGPQTREARILAGIGVLLFTAALSAAVFSVTAGLAIAAFPVAAVIGYFVVQSKEAVHALVLGGTAFVILSQEGVGGVEIAYAAVLALFLAYWYGIRLFSGHRFCEGALDYAVAILLFAFIPLATFVGLAFGSPLGNVRGDLMGFAPLALYFPVKDLCRNSRHGVLIVGAVILWLGLFVATDIFLNFRSVVTAAVLDWQIADARPGYNALQLTAGSLVALSIAIHSPKRLVSIALLVVFAYLMGALILIKYRAFWIAAAVGLLTLAVLADPVAKRKLAVASTAGFVLAGALFYFFLGDLVILFLSGTAERAATLGGLDRDISLVNRFWEAKFVLEHVAANPILGYGFGTEYGYHSLIHRAYYEPQHIHIGYVAPLFRLGLIGTILLFAVWIGCTEKIWKTYKHLRGSDAPIHHKALLLASVATLVSMIPSVLAESPWFVINMMIGFAITIGLGMGLYQRYKSTGPEAGL